MLCINCSKFATNSNKRGCVRCKSIILNNLSVICDNCSKIENMCSICLKKLSSPQKHEKVRSKCSSCGKK